MKGIDKRRTQAKEGAIAVAVVICFIHPVVSYICMYML